MNTLSTADDTLWARFQAHPNICTDSRKLRAGDLFFALTGPHFNGNTFAQTALAQGAAYAVVDDPSLQHEPRMHWVPDALLALQQLALRNRREHAIPLLAITGSNGKTTTKQLIASVLAQTKLTGNTVALVTPGNFNNHIGLPLTLLQLRKHHRCVVLEMGDNKPGDIAELCRIAEPNAGLITNIGLDHLDGYGGSMDVNAATKLELFEYVAQTGGQLLVNNDDERLAAHPLSPAAREYSWGANGRFRVEIQEQSVAGMELTLVDTLASAPYRLKTHLVGTYNAANVAACWAACEWLGVSVPDRITGIGRYIPQDNRSQIITTDAHTILLDAYNANPSSMTEALQAAFNISTGNLLVVLGDMRELGDYTAEAHAAVGRQLSALRSTFPHTLSALLVGTAMTSAADAVSSEMRARTACFQDTETAKQAFAEMAKQAQFILIKGSRGLKLETFVKQLTQE